jgi:tetratricopeptide (TPR) repeat protein
MVKKSIWLVLILLIVAASVAPYANAPQGYFIWDDINLIVLDYQIKSWKFIGKVFTRDFFGFSDNSKKYGYYRPLVTISYMLEWQLWGKNPAGYHWINILLHSLNCLLVFAILAKFFRRKLLVPTIAALLFAATPIHTESVTWIAGRTDPMCSLFYLLAFYFYMSFSERIAVREGFEPAPEYDPDRAKRRAAPALALSLLCFTLATFAKEMALSLPFVLIAYTLIFSADVKWIRFKRYIVSLLMFFVVTLGYAATRTVVSFSEQASDPFNAVTTILSFVKTITVYIWKMAFPVYLTAYFQNELVEEVFTKEFLVPFAFLVVMVWVVFRSLRSNKMLAFGISWMLLTFLPLSNFIRISGPKDMGFMASERFLYIPSFGFCLLLAMVFGALIGRIGPLLGDPDKKPKAMMRATALVLLGAVLVLYTGLTLKRNLEWMDNETFFKATLERAPNAPILYMLLGNVYSLEHKWEKAEETLKMAIEYMSPRDREEPTWIYADLAGVYAKQGLYAKALETMKLADKSKMHNSAVEYNYGEIYRAMGNFEKAIEYYISSLRIARDNHLALVKLGMSYQQLKNWELSNKAFLAASHLTPNDYQILNNIGYNYSHLGDSAKAIHYFNESIKRNPDFARSHGNLGRELVKQGKRLSDAVESLKIAVRLDPRLIEPRLILGGLASKQDPEIALRIFQEAYSVNPKNIKTIMYIGLYFQNMGDTDQARKWFTKALSIDPKSPDAKKFLSDLVEQGKE